MGFNRLKLNLDKTQLIWLGKMQRLATLDITPVRLHESTVSKPFISVRNLGVILDSELSMSENVSSVTRTYFHHLRQMRFVRRLLTSSCAKMPVHVFVSSRVDLMQLLAVRRHRSSHSQVASGHECCCTLNLRLK